MNLLIILKNEICENKAIISGSRVEHLNKILNVKKGSEIKVGVYGGKKGYAEIEKINDREAILNLNLTESPQPKIPLNIIVGLCRPKVLSRLISDLTSIGVSRIDIIQTYFGDKGYWDNGFLSKEGIETATIKGLEQSMDTIPPEINLIKRFGPYSNDILPDFTTGNSRGFFSDPYAENNMQNIQTGLFNTAAIGPERGFTKYEKQQFLKAGFIPFKICERILRTETAAILVTSSFLT